MYQNDPFIVSFSIPYVLFILALGFSLTGYLLSKSLLNKRIWIFAGIGELLLAFAIFRILPCFCPELSCCVFQAFFCALTLGLILAGIWFFKPLTN